MVDETVTPQEGTNPEPKIEVEETIADEGTDESQDTPEEESIDDLKEKLAKAEEAKRQLTARAKRAEDAAKATQVKPQKTTKSDVPTEELIDIQILKSKGFTDDLINDARVIAKARGVSIMDVQSDPVFLGIKKQKDEEVKAAKAKLGASRGSSSVKKEKTLATPGLTDEEHKALWKAQQMER